jgi:NADH-quinone oxidoreductase subunit N
MDLSVLQHLAAGNSWGAIWPEIALGCLALLLLVLEIVLPKAAHARIPDVSLAGQVLILLALGLCGGCGNSCIGRDAFNGLIRLSAAGQAMRAFFLVSSILATILARVTLARQAMPRVEFHAITLTVAAALMLLVQSSHFVMLFVALETVTVGFYVLVSYSRTSALTLEAGLKYLIMGALSSAVLLFGIALLYGVAGNPTIPGHVPDPFRYDSLALFLAAHPHNFIASTGILLVVAGIAFKIGVVPFQIWVPDVYQGAPTPVTALLAVASKAAGFSVLLVLYKTVFEPYAWLLTPALTVMAGATLLFGNLAALTQHNVKRLIGLSGVSHAGFLLMGVVAAAGAPLAFGAVYFYLYAYLLGSFAVFGVMVHLAGENDADQEIGDYAGLAKDNPFLAAVLAVGLGSLAGIPPLAGFMGKFLVFLAAFQARLYPLLAVAVIGVVLSIYYYFGWIRAAYFGAAERPDESRPARTNPGAVATFALSVLALGSVILGLYQGPFANLINF